MQKSATRFRSKCLIGNGFILKHDNDPKQTANAVKADLDREKHSGAPSVMDWPPPEPGP